MLASLPKKFVTDYFIKRRLLVKKLLNIKDIDAVRKIFAEQAPLLSPMVATEGPARLNNAPFMITFVPKILII